MEQSQSQRRIQTQSCRGSGSGQGSPRPAPARPATSTAHPTSAESEETTINASVPDKNNEEKRFSIIADYVCLALCGLFLFFCPVPECVSRL